MEQVLIWKQFKISWAKTKLWNETNRRFRIMTFILELD